MHGVFSQAVTQIAKQTGSLKRSLYPFATQALTDAIAWFPGVIGQLVCMWVVSKATIVMSNIPGPKKHLTF